MHCYIPSSQTSWMDTPQYRDTNQGTKNRWCDYFFNHTPSSQLFEIESCYSTSQHALDASGKANKVITRLIWALCSTIWSDSLNQVDIWLLHAPPTAEWVSHKHSCLCIYILGLHKRVFQWRWIFSKEWPVWECSCKWWPLEKLSLPGCSWSSHWATSTSSSAWIPPLWLHPV